MGTGDCWAGFGDCDPDRIPGFPAISRDCQEIRMTVKRLWFESKRAGSGQKMAFARATVLCFLVIWFSTQSRSLMVLFGSLLDQFVSSFDRANRLSMFQFDAVRFIDFSANDFDLSAQWITRDSCSVLDFWKSKIKIYVVVDAYCVNYEFWNACCSISASSPARQYCSSFVFSSEDRVC